jgi:hypothetical protein
MQNRIYHGRCALVTGASSGIGAAFAGTLAARGARLVLTARRLDRLTALAETLRRTHDVAVDVLAADLADPATPARLCATLTERGLAIDLLINNAGYGVPGHFLAPSWAVHAAFLQVLLTAPCELVYRLLPGMRARGYGRIVNVASLAGLVPGSPGHTLYGATKAFLIQFSESLALENAAHGVRVTALCPGFTQSEFHDITGTRAIVSRLPRWMWQTAEYVAADGLAAIERGAIVHVPGRINRAIKTLFKLLPRRSALRLIEKHAGTFRRRDT